MFRTALLVLALATGAGAPHLDRFLDLVSGFWVAGQGEAGGHYDPNGAGNILDPDGAVDNSDVGNHADPDGIAAAGAVARSPPPEPDFSAISNWARRLPDFPRQLAFGRIVCPISGANSNQAMLSADFLAHRELAQADRPIDFAEAPRRKKSGFPGRGDGMSAPVARQASPSRDGGI